MTAHGYAPFGEKRNVLKLNWAVVSEACEFSKIKKKHIQMC